MTATYQQLTEQIKALQQQAEEARKRELRAAVEQVQELIQQYGLTQEDVFPPTRAKSSSGSKVAPKYRDPATGATWTGRGKAPKWIQEQDREKFAI